MHMLWKLLFCSVELPLSINVFVSPGGEPTWMIMILGAELHGKLKIAEAHTRPFVSSPGEAVTVAQEVVITMMAKVFFFFFGYEDNPPFGGKPRAHDLAGKSHEPGKSACADRLDPMVRSKVRLSFFTQVKRQRQGSNLGPHNTPLLLTTGPPQRGHDGQGL